MKLTKDRRFLPISLIVLLLLHLVPVQAEAVGTVQESPVHTYSQNTWAWNALAEGPNGEIYLTHKVSATAIAVKKWNGSSWDSLPSVTTTLTSDTGFSDSLDLEVDKDGKVHLVYKHYIGEGVTSHRGVKYGVYDGTKWTFSEVEGYSHPNGWRNFYDPTLAVDSNGNAHIVYKYVDTQYYAKYATNQSGSWQTQVIATGTSGTDEVHDPIVRVDGQDVVHLSYVKEDHQNTYYGNYYYTKKALNDASFPAAQKIIDAIAEEQYYYYTPLIVDENGKAYVGYDAGIYSGDTKTGTNLYIHSNQSGSWKRETLYEGTGEDLYFTGLYSNGAALYALVDSWSLDGAEGHFFAMANYGSGWITGSKKVVSQLIVDYANELTYMVDAQGSFTLAMLHGGLRNISTLYGTSNDFGLIQSLSDNADLASLMLSDGTLSPAFDKATASYTASVGHSVAAIDVTPSAEDAKATITVNGTSVASGSSSSVPLQVGANIITVTVTAEDGSTKTYTVTITRAPASSNADLNSLAVSEGTLDPQFDAATTEYAVSVDNSKASIIVTPTVSDANAAVTVNGQPPATPVSLIVGSNQITVEVIAENGTVKTYTVNVTRELLKGDGNGDGKVTSADALMVYQYTSGKIQLTALQKKALDMNNDGQVNAVDANLIMKAAVGK